MTNEEFWEFQRRVREARSAKPKEYPPRFVHLRYPYYDFMKPYANFVPGPDDPEYVDVLVYFWFKPNEIWQNSMLVMMDGWPTRQQLVKVDDNTWEGMIENKGETHIVRCEIHNPGHIEENGKTIRGADVTLTIDDTMCYRTADFYWHGNPNGSMGHTNPDLGDWSGIVVCTGKDLPDDITSGEDRYVVWHYQVVKEDIGG